jgi:DNA invertase Pin-like site-specific DNA recombinase
VRVGIYARISEDVAGRGLGVRRQTDDCRALAKLRGWTVAETYTDNDVSAYKATVVRPEFERMVKELEAGLLDGVVSYDLDRFARKPSDLERVISIYDRRGGVFATVQGDIDLSTADGRTMARVMVAFANKASMDTSRRVKRKHLELAQKGVPVGGNRPFGYKADKITIEPAEAELIREATAQILSGVGLHTVCRAWNEQGVKTTRGNAWVKAVLRHMLLSPRLAGYRVYQGGIARNSSGQPVTGLYAPILDISTWEALCAHLTDPARSGAHVHPGGRKYLLSGIARCASCTATLQGNADRKYGTLFFYSCHNQQCGQRVAVTGPRVDELVTKLVLAYLADRDIEQPADTWAGDEALADATTRIVELLEQYSSGTLSGDIVFPTVQKLEDRVARLRAEKADWLRDRVVVKRATNAVEAWPTMEIDQQRSVIGSVLHAVVVKPGQRGGRFDPDRIEPIFR